MYSRELHQKASGLGSGECTAALNNTHLTDVCQTCQMVIQSSRLISPRPHQTQTVDARPRSGLPSSGRSPSTTKELIFCSNLKHFASSSAVLGFADFGSVHTNSPLFSLSSAHCKQTAAAAAGNVKYSTSCTQKDFFFLLGKIHPTAKVESLLHGIKLS